MSIRTSEALDIKSTHIDNLANEKCFTHFACIRRMTDIFERFSAIVTGLFEQYLAAAWMLKFDH
jgi:hypothetical protein